MKSPPRWWAVAPYDDDSGKRHGQRCIKGARRWYEMPLHALCRRGDAEHPVSRLSINA